MKRPRGGCEMGTRPGDRSTRLYPPCGVPLSAPRASPARCACCASGCDGSVCACRLPGLWDGPNPCMFTAEEQAKIRPFDPGCCACTAPWVGR